MRNIALLALLMVSFNGFANPMVMRIDVPPLTESERSYIKEEAYYTLFYNNRYMLDDNRRCVSKEVTKTRSGKQRKYGTIDNCSQQIYIIKSDRQGRLHCLAYRIWLNYAISGPQMTHFGEQVSYCAGAREDYHECKYGPACD